MTKYTKAQAISVIVDCARKYHDELENRSLLFVCLNKHKKVVCFEFFFFARNFRHLTGVDINTLDSDELASSTNFYEKCLSRKLSPDDFEFRADGTTFLKLQVLPKIISKNLSAKMIGDFISNKPKLYTEKLAGGQTGCMGFRRDADTGKHIPDTVLNEDIRNLVAERVRVIAVYRKRQEEKQYSELTYVAKKDVDWASTTYPQEYNYIKKPIV